MSIDEIMINGEDKMQKAIGSIKKEFANIRTGRANPMILDKVQVDYYGVSTPVRQLANVTVQDGTTLVIQPFERNLISEVEKSIAKTDIGITPNNDGACIRLSFPQPTEERRKDLVKEVKKAGEDGKVAVRNVRRDMADNIKKLGKEESLSEDQIKDYQDDVQKLTDKYNKEIENLVAEKEKEVLTV